MRNPIWNQEERRPRAAWRLLLAFGLWQVVTPVASMILPVGIALVVSLRGQVPQGAGISGLTDLVNQALNQNPVLITLQLVMGTVGVLAAVWLAGRLVDRRPLRAFGLGFDRRWWLDFGFGLALGAVLMALVFVVERAAGWVTVTGMYRASYPFFWVAMAVGVMRYLTVAMQEELLMRGYLLRNLAEGLNLGVLGPRGGLLLAYLGSSIFFGLMHWGNPNATWTSTFNIMIAGLMLGLGYVLTGELGISIGLHLTWNYFQGFVFGFPVSGGAGATSLFAIQQSGPVAWTGGAFGPEAGWVGLAAVLLGCLLTFVWVRWVRGRIELFRGLAEYEPAAPVQHLKAAERITGT